MHGPALALRPHTTRIRARAWDGPELPAFRRRRLRPRPSGLGPPHRLAPPRSVHPPAPTGLSTAAPGMTDSPATVFVADDNPSILQGLDRALKVTGYHVRTAVSGRAVLDLLESADTLPDLLLLDVMMPEMSGLEVLR